MPVRKRIDRRASRPQFDVTPELADAFRAYINSTPEGGSFSSWPEHWRLHDLLDAVGALEMPLVPPCCFHPRLAGIRWEHASGAVAIFRRLEREA